MERSWSGRLDRREPVRLQLTSSENIHDQVLARARPWHQRQQGGVVHPGRPLVASSTCPYDTHYFNGNWAEQNPQDWWRAICLSTQELLSKAKASASDVAVVALSGQMMGCTPVGKEGNALRPSILYCDQRATREAGQILSKIDLKSFYDIAGHRVSPSYVLEKLMWIRRKRTGDLRPYPQEPVRQRLHQLPADGPDGHGLFRCHGLQRL